MKYIDWIKDVMSGKIIPLPKVKTYDPKAVNTICDYEDSRLQKTK